MSRPASSEWFAHRNKKTGDLLGTPVRLYQTRIMAERVTKSRFYKPQDIEVVEVELIVKPSQT